MVRRGGPAGGAPDGSSTDIVSAARRIAASLSSLAWAKAVVSPDTPRRPNPAWVLKSAVFSRPSSKPNALRRGILEVELAIVAALQRLGGEALGGVGIEPVGAVEEAAGIGGAGHGADIGSLRSEVEGLVPSEGEGLIDSQPGGYPL